MCFAISLSFSLQGFILIQLGYLSFLKYLHAVAYHISRMTLLEDIFHHRIVLIGKRRDSKYSILTCKYIISRLEFIKHIMLAP